MRNGLKLQLAISVLILGGVVALFLQFYAYTHKPDPKTIRIADIAIETTTVARGDELVWSLAICNDTKKPVSISLSVHFVTPPPEREVIVPGALTDTFEPGCAPPRQRVTVLPHEVTPGAWRLRASITTTSAAGLLNFTSATSDPFSVTEGETGSGE